MKLCYENVITDLRHNGIDITKTVFDMMNEFVDLQNSYITKLSPNVSTKLGDKTVLVGEGKNIVAVYTNGKFMWNPNKLRLKDLPEYDVYEVFIQGTHVQNRREERRDYLKGLTPTRDAKYSNVPKSTTYIWDKDWNPETNKNYYVKLLQRNHLGKYTQDLNDAYDIVKQLIDQRRDRLTGKRTEYDRMITDISKQIGKIEDEMIAAERDFSFDPTKLKKEMSKLPNLISKAEMFIKSEEQEYKHWGKRKKIPYDKIEK